MIYFNSIKEPEEKEDGYWYWNGIKYSSDTEAWEAYREYLHGSKEED